MTPDDAKLIAELADAEARATKGPWISFLKKFGPDPEDYHREIGTQVNDGIDSDYTGGIAEMFGDPFDDQYRTDSEGALNGAFIALARNALPRLLALVREQDAALAWYGEHAAAIARYVQSKPANTTAIEAVVVTLALDAGRRAHGGEGAKR